MRHCFPFDFPSAVASFTVSVKPSALSAGSRMFDLKYQEQSARSFDPQGYALCSPPPPPSRGDILH